jgi:DNA-binding SARP family transcriptional activator
MATVEFLVLGPLEVRVEASPLRISGGKQRALLACLLLAYGRPLTTGELVASIYGADADAAAVHSLHELVSKLRRTLGAVDLAELLQSAAGGYGLDIDPSQLDARRFEDLLAQARAAGDPRVRADLFQRALQLWRGPALADTELEGEARAEVQRLEELRWAALGDSLDQELAAGGHMRAIAELERLTRLQPYNERFRGQLMLALYRGGRQADALRAYQEIRGLLADELGLEPTDRLRELERSILNHDPELLLAAARTPLRRPLRKRRRPLIAAVAAVAAIAVGAAVATGSFGGEQASKAVFEDSLTGADLNTKFWDVATFGTGPSVLPGHNGVLLTIPAHAASADPTGAIKARMSSYCTLAGEFDIQVDYNLLKWPAANRTGVGMYAAYADLVRESGPTGEQYVGAVRHLDPPDGAPHVRVPTHDTRGTLRIVRSGNRMTELARQGGDWLQVNAFPNPTPAAVSVLLELWTSTQRFSHREVQVELTNFRVSSGSLECPPD